MNAVKITPFSGLLPKIGSRLLPEASAVVANNMKLQSGEIRPLNAPSLVSVPNKPKPSLAVYLARDGLNNFAWFSWEFDVDVVRAPLSVSVESRYYWTGDGAPKFATYTKATTGGLNNYPSSAFDLGIPTPQTKPSVAASGGVGAAVTRFYVYTFISELGEESAPSPVSTILTGKVDDTWAITGMDAIPANSGTGTAAFASGETTFTDAASAKHWLRVGDSVVISSTTLTVTAVPTADSFKVAGDFHTATSWARLNNWNTANMKRRLYRTAGTTASFQLVADNISTTTYNDTLSDSAILGDELITQGWIPPPVGLKGITEHPSGALVGFVDNILCFSIPYQPHAWRTSDQLASNYSIIGIAVYNTEIGVATKGSAYVASGVDPESMSLQAIKGIYPCLSKRSVCSLGNGFIYSTAHGMALVSADGISMLTSDFYTKDEWALINPSSVISAAAYGRIYLAYTRSDNSQSMLVIGDGQLITADVIVNELYTDESTGELYITNENGINAWDSSTAYPLISDWVSKDFVFPKPINIGAAKIDFTIAIDPVTQAALQAIIDAINASNATIYSSGKARGALNSKSYNTGIVNGSDIQQAPSIPPSNLVTFILRRKDGKLVASKTVSSGLVFKLPAGYKDDVFSVEIISQSKIKEVRFGETAASLGAV